MQTGRKDTRTLLRSEQMEYRKRVWITAAVMAVIILASLCLKTEKHGFVAPHEVFINYWTWIKLSIGKVSGWTVTLKQSEILAGLPSYIDSVNRFKITVISFVCGVMLAMAGALFQGVFRNPIAAPTMLGVSTGVNLGILILVVQYGGMALYMPFQKYVYCCACAAGVLILLMIMAKISSGRQKFSVTDLLIVSAIVTQVIGAVQTYFTFSMENDEVLLMQELKNVMDIDTGTGSFIFLGAALLISVVPVFFMRFSLNTISFTDEEARSLGVNSFGIKLAALIAGTFMTVSAMVHCGGVGMISLIVPFLSRAVFGADFRKVFTGNVLIGGTLMVLCRDLSGQIFLTPDGIPVGTIADFIAMPVFVIIIITQRRIWE